MLGLNHLVGTANREGIGKQRRFMDGAALRMFILPAFRRIGALNQSLINLHAIEVYYWCIIN